MNYESITKEVFLEILQCLGEKLWENKLERIEKARIFYIDSCFYLYGITGFNINSYFGILELISDKFML